MTHPRPGRSSATQTDSTVAGEDWYGQDVSGQNHPRTAFVDLDMTEVTNDGAVFDECTFRGARFTVSSHANAAFVNCTFTGCTFFDARFTGCKFVGSKFDRCTFDVM
ncbi:MAG TPA: pentapeptide repeat-containing protein, partial [Candidatus Elarobacter sp.]|nr:pentapeptide repeat-containing protein [Candidatus Elarobacter sp.]